jgi:lipoprotein-releasing system ATP-binding protein
MSEVLRAPRLVGTEIAKGFRSGPGRLEVLRGASITVGPREIVAVVGPSGSGKSTLLHCLGGLDRPDSGRVEVDGIELSGLRDKETASVRNLKIGFVFQFHHLLPDFTALENVMLPLLVAGRPQSEARERAHELLEEVGLAARETHAPSELSGGEQQRVAVARALANAPAAILADEPSGNLDAHTAADLHRLITRLRDERGASFLIATHDASLARRADRVLALGEGRLSPIDPHLWAEDAGRRLEEARR